MIAPIKALKDVGFRIFKPAIKVCSKIKVNKPEVMMGAGVIMVIGSFVWIAINATKIPETANETAEKVSDIEDEYTCKLEETDDQHFDDLITQQRKDLRKARVDGIIRMGKLILPPTITMLVGVSLGVKGHMVRKKEVIVLTTAAKSLQETFKYYRKNVVEKEGKEADLNYLRGVKGETEVTEVGQDAQGNDILVKRKVPVVDENRPRNPWRFEFSPTFFASASGIPDRDISKLIQVQEYFNHVYHGPKKFGKISNYEILEYLQPIWEAIDADGTVEMFCRNYGYGHDVRGDDNIDLGVYRAINAPAISGTGDVVYIEFNSDGNLKNLKNKYLEKYRGKA